MTKVTPKLDQAAREMDRAITLWIKELYAIHLGRGLTEDEAREEVYRAAKNYMMNTAIDVMNTPEL